MNTQGYRVKQFLGKLIWAIAFIVFVASIVLVIREFWRGDFTEYGEIRIGAICSDGWHSESTGRGTCSHHGGVHHWIYPIMNVHKSNPTPYFVSMALSFFVLFLFRITHNFNLE
jgi:hypothetical protein